jgi:hypothetical protein
MARHRRATPRFARANEIPIWPLDPPRNENPATGSQVSEADRAPAPVDQPTRSGYYCRHCGATGPSPVPPAGWLRAQRRGTGQGSDWRLWATLGLYCGVPCLVADLAPGQAR